MSLTSRVVLDPTGSSPAGESTLITTEVAFWEAALGRQPLTVRGRELCEWAEAFYSARGESTAVFRPPYEALRDLLPELSAEQAGELAARLSDLTGALELRAVASELFGQPFFLDAPDTAHAETYLLWRLGAEPTEAERVLLEALTQEYTARAAHPEAGLYAVTDAAGAFVALKSWLGLDGRRERQEAFSQTLPDGVRRLLQGEVRAHVAGNHGFFDALRQSGADRQLLTLAAEVTAEVYQMYPEGLERAALLRLSPYLGRAAREALEGLLPFAEPPAVPHGALELFRWFEHDYLPYRTWPRHDSAVVARLGRAFAEVYLGLYARALSGSGDRELLSWNRTAALKGGGAVTLLVVLDGLGFADVGVIKDELNRLDTQGRFTFAETALAFGPLPSITWCSKPALEGGLSPDRADRGATLGVKFTSDTGLTGALRSARPGEVVLWSLTEPDSTYHKNKVLETSREMARRALGGVVKRLLEHTKPLDAGVPLQIVVTTDHGRLLGSSSRTQTAPSDMNAEGRAATGPSGRTFPEAGYVVEDDLVYLSRERFRMAEDAAVVLSDDSFLTSDGRQGTDAFPHGGLYPEEVLVPWLLLTRDLELQPLTARLSGEGEADRTAELVLAVNNPNLFALTLETLTLSFVGTPLTLDARAAPLRETPLTVPITLPGSQLAEAATATLTYRLPDGSPQGVRVDVAITSREMYAANNALEDLL